MKPKAKPRTHEQPLIATMSLELALDMDHDLVRLAGVIPWNRLAEEFGPLYCADNGRPAVPIRLMAGLHYLKHLKGLSDEQTVYGWVENPYWQFFCGEEFFQHALPIDPSQMTRWRQRIGEEGVERLLQATITAGKATRAIPEDSRGNVIADTTGLGRWRPWASPAGTQAPRANRLVRNAGRDSHPEGLRLVAWEGGIEDIDVHVFTRLGYATVSRTTSPRSRRNAKIFS